MHYGNLSGIVFFSSSNAFYFAKMKSKVKKGNSIMSYSLEMVLMRCLISMKYRSSKEKVTTKRRFWRNLNLRHRIFLGNVRKRNLQYLRYNEWVLLPCEQHGLLSKTKADGNDEKCSSWKLQHKNNIDFRLISGS